MSKLDDLTIGEARQLTALFQTNVRPLPFNVGSAYFIRTVTYHLIGIVEEVIGDFLLLRDASWIADSGRFMQALQNGTLNEVEPVGTAFVNIRSITDAFFWRHPLPKEQK